MLNIFGTWYPLKKCTDFFGFIKRKVLICAICVYFASNVLVTLFVFNRNFDDIGQIAFDLLLRVVVDVFYQFIFCEFIVDISSLCKFLLLFVSTF